MTSLRNAPMGNVPKSRTTHQKLSIFRERFSGLPHTYGTYDPKTGKARQVKERVTDRVILRHVQGRQPYGVYLLVDDRTQAVVADFDDEDTWAPSQFIRRARHYCLSAYLERSKRKGWHVWMFFDLPGMSARKARIVVQSILDEIEMPSTEVFPRQDRLTGRTSYGNFINAPLFGDLVPEGRTVFVDPENGLKPYADQWDFLTQIQRIPSSTLDDVIEVNDLDRPADKPPKHESPDRSLAVRPTFGLPPCARRMLAEGVVRYQRVACFRLAVHLKKTGLPEDTAAAVLKMWAAKNRPTDGNRIITEAEIRQQTTAAYTKSYRACGCEEPAVKPYCRPDCPLMRRASQPSRNKSRPSP